MVSARLIPAALAAADTPDITDWLQAVGTVAAALLTLAAVIVSMKASARAEAAARASLVEQQRLAREGAAREYRLETLDKVLTQVTSAFAYANGPQAIEAKTVLPGLLASLGEDGLPLTRLQFGDGDTQELARWRAAASPSGRMPSVQQEILREIAAEIRASAARTDR